MVLVAKLDRDRSCKIVSALERTWWVLFRGLSNPARTTRWRRRWGSVVGVVPHQPSAAPAPAPAQSSSGWKISFHCAVSHAPEKPDHTTPPHHAPNIRVAFMSLVALSSSSRLISLGQLTLLFSPCITQRCKAKHLNFTSPDIPVSETRT